MSEFYSELKEVRQSRNISLEEIHNRTKINIKYLDAIENGNFDILPLPYMRLFLKAYVTEIGSDYVQALQQFEVHQSKIHGKKIKQPEPVKLESELPIKEKTSTPGFSRPPVQMRSDLIKGVALLVVFLFAIFIIRKINDDKSTLANEPKETTTEQFPETISKVQLSAEYVNESSLSTFLNVSPPFDLKITANERIWFTLTLDSINTTSGFLSVGDEKIISFTKNFYVLLNQTKGAALSINAFQISDLGDQQYPVEVIFNSDPNSVTVKHYKPLK